MILASEILSLYLEWQKQVEKQDDKLIYLKNNHLYFHTDVSEQSIDEVKKLMRTYWNKCNVILKSHNCVEFKPKPLYIHIFSPGGCAYSGFSLYDFIIEYKKKSLFILLLKVEQQVLLQLYQ